MRLASDLEVSSHIPYDETVHTRPLCSRINALIPEEADWGAREDRAEDCPAGVGRDDGDQRVTGPAEVRLWEDSKVLQQDGQLGTQEGGVVDPEACPEPFGGPYDFVFGECVLVTTSAVYDCSR